MTLDWFAWIDLYVANICFGMMHVWPEPECETIPCHDQQAMRPRQTDYGSTFAAHCSGDGSR